MSNITKQSVDVLSLSEPEFIDLLRGLQDFLKAKLEPCKDDQGAIYYGSFVKKLNIGHSVCRSSLKAVT